MGERIANVMVLIERAVEAAATVAGRRLRATERAEMERTEEKRQGGLKPIT